MVDGIGVRGIGVSKVRRDRVETLSYGYWEKDHAIWAGVAVLSGGSGLNPIYRETGLMAMDMKQKNQAIRVVVNTLTPSDHWGGG
jgi:hypothetical protein